jgi:tRNA(Ile)-lysidine synthase
MWQELKPNFTPLDQAANILIAVSGGPDSLALMHLTREWAAESKSRPALERRLFTATVDHGLRQGSRAEAETVAQWAAALGVPHKILIWEGEKPGTRVQELAREARYGLLLDYAYEIQADVLLTAHHADDQAETILFRLLRGSGLAGLAGMEASIERAGLLHCRPLLAMPKSALIEICETRGQPFFTDPSNSNPAFARTRLRGLMDELAAIGLDRIALIRLGKRAARAEKALALRTETIISRVVSLCLENCVRVDIEALAEEPEEIWLRLIDYLIHRVTGAKGPLRLERLESLVAVLRASWFEKKPFAATLGGAKIRLELTKTATKPVWIIKIAREPARGSRKSAAKPAL